MQKREWLIQLRKSKQLTQQQIASSAFIDRSYYTQIEIGKRNPSITVANNIADVLDFAPIMFFQEHMNPFSFETNQKRKKFSHSILCDYFKNLKDADILYLYEDIKKYQYYALTFLLVGIEKEDHCIIIDSQENLSIKEKLNKTLHKKDIKNIYTIETELLKNDKSFSTDYIRSLQSKLGNDTFITIWAHQTEDTNKDYVSNLKNSITKRKLNKNKNIFFIGVFNASLVTADMHISMMRNYPYLMTDDEIVVSPLYSSNKQNILPSFYIEENNM